jgi:hypothetical protein
MKKQLETIINAIEWEVEYQTTDGDHWSNLISCLLVDDIAYNTERYIEALTEQCLTIESINPELLDSFIQYVVNEWLPYNGDMLEGELTRNYWSPKTALLYCAIDEIEVHFPSRDMEKPSKMLQNYINNKTDYYCDDDVISVYMGGDGIAFSLSDDALVEVYNDWIEEGMV